MALNRMNQSVAEMRMITVAAAGHGSRSFELAPRDRLAAPVLMPLIERTISRSQAACTDACAASAAVPGSRGWKGGRSGPGDGPDRQASEREGRGPDA